MTARYNFYNLEALFSQYLDAENVENQPITKKLSPVSKKNYLSDFRFFSGWYESFPHESVPSSFAELVQSITPEIIESFRDYIVDSGLPLQTLNRRLSTLRKFFEFAIQQQWISSNPAKKVVNIRQGEEVLLAEPVRTSLEAYALIIKKDQSGNLETLKDFFINSSVQH